MPGVGPDLITKLIQPILKCIHKFPKFLELQSEIMLIVVTTTSRSGTVWRPDQRLRESSHKLLYPYRILDLTMIFHMSTKDCCEMSHKGYCTFIRHRRAHRLRQILMQLLVFFLKSLSKRL